MTQPTSTQLAENISLNEQLRKGAETMLEPQDLPGRFGRVVRDVDHVLQAINCEGVLAGGWAVWRHGFAARVTQDVDVVLAADRIEEFVRIASLSGFQRLECPSGTWPKVEHRDTGITVDLLPEGERPGTTSRPAPTTIPSPKDIGGVPATLRYVLLPSLVELKLAAGRAKDLFDVVELLRTNSARIDEIRKHLTTVHQTYVETFEELLLQAQEPER